MADTTPAAMLKQIDEIKAVVHGDKPEWWDKLLYLERYWRATAVGLSDETPEGIVHDVRVDAGLED